MQSMAQHKLGLGHRSFDRIYQKKAAVCHAEDTLYLTAEIGMPWRINDIDFDVPVYHSRILRHDGNPLFSLKGITVHDKLAHCLVISKDIALLEHGIHQGGLAMVNVGNNSYIPDITAIVHVWCNPAFLYGAILPFSIHVYIVFNSLLSIALS
jgi:hypothetical protein